MQKGSIIGVSRKHRVKNNGSDPNGEEAGWKPVAGKTVAGSSPVASAYGKESTMDIGGKDLWFETGTQTQWESAQNFFRSLWPDHVVETIDDKMMADEELFIYENQEVLDRLEADGIVGDLGDRFVHFLRSEGKGFTVVVGDDFNEAELRKTIESV